VAKALNGQIRRDALHPNPLNRIRVPANADRARGRNALPDGDRWPRGTVGLIDEAKNLTKAGS
jgi:hypothetical protein